MTIHILTLFPEIFESVFTKSIIKRAVDKNLVRIEFINIRDFGLGRHKQVDDKPYGGGDGMVMMIEPFARALGTIKPKPYTIMLSASGEKFAQQKAKSFSSKKSLAIICGHYEGVDARVEKLADEIIGIGDFVTTGGEIPAMLIVDATVRLIPGVISPNSPLNESFETNFLEHPQYTRPEAYNGLKVPSVLLGGNHDKINKWRQSEAQKRTKKYRPDLFKKNS